MEDIVKLKIISCSVSVTGRFLSGCWYTNKIGKSYKFFNKIFLDDNGIEGLWFAEVPRNRYVYLKDVNYKKAIRKRKLKNINKLNK